MNYYYVDGSNEAKGPVSVEVLKQLLGAGTVSEDTLVAPVGANDWKKLGEMKLMPAPASTVDADLSTQGEKTHAGSISDGDVERLQLERRIQSSGSWFFWVAGLSLINTIIQNFGSDTSFIVGLGVTQFLEGFAAQFGETAKLVGLALSVLVSGLFAGFGVFAVKRQLWAFYVGLALYLGDTLIYILVQEWLSVAFHVYVIYSLILGVIAIREWKGRIAQSPVPN